MILVAVQVVFSARVLRHTMIVVYSRTVRAQCENARSAIGGASLVLQFCLFVAFCCYSIAVMLGLVVLYWLWMDLAKTLERLKLTKRSSAYRAFIFVYLRKAERPLLNSSNLWMIGRV